MIHFLSIKGISVLDALCHRLSGSIRVKSQEIVNRTPENGERIVSLKNQQGAWR
jgi:hypothetical protein